MNTTNTAGRADAILNSLWAVAKNPASSSTAQHAAAEAALGLQNALQNNVDLDLVIDLADSTLAVLKKRTETTQGPKGDVVDLTGGSQPGATIFATPASVGLKMLQDHHPDAVVLGSPGALEAAFETGAFGYAVELPGSLWEPPTPPDGFCYVVLDGKGGDTDVEFALRPMKIICKENDELPAIDAEEEIQYFEVERAPGSPDWIVYKLMDPLRLFFAKFEKARKVEDPGPALTKLIAESEVVSIEPDKARYLVAMVVKNPTVSTEVLFDRVAEHFGWNEDEDEE